MCRQVTDLSTARLCQRISSLPTMAFHQIFLTRSSQLILCTLRMVTRRSSWKAWPDTDVPEEIEKRKRFWELERLRESVLEYDHLSETEQRIHDAHKEAVRRGHFTYDDPAGGGIVETRYKHFLTGLCCGSACRHCIFNFYNVPKYMKASKTFNSSFWVDTGDSDSKLPPLDLKKFFLRKLKDRNSSDAAAIQPSLERSTS